MKYTVGELFAGIGGIGLGFQQAGFELFWANEIDERACLTYSKNFTHKIINEDIKLISTKSLDHVDVITAGFPCQAFSIAGYRKGFSDERGSLFFDIIRFLRDIRPKVLFLENVKNLLSHNNGQTYRTIQETLITAGYYTCSKVLNTLEYSNIPQNRERLYIVCFRNENFAKNFTFPLQQHGIMDIHDLLDTNVDEKYFYTNNKLNTVLKETITDSNTFYQWRRKYVRTNKNRVCPTLTANMGTGGHNVPLILDKNQKIRKLTPRECARFQGFPDSFVLPEQLPDSALYKQIGNSVTVPVIKAIANCIMKVLDEKN